MDENNGLGTVGDVVNSKAVVEEKQRWFGRVPEVCDLNGCEITDIFIDGKVRRAWANMCPTCHRMFGQGLGTGRGQMYQKEEGGSSWFKVEG